MRSELVTQAAGPVPNRFLLVHVASKITRKFHRRTRDRLPESINNSLAGLGEGKFLTAGNLVTMGVPDLDWYNGITGEAKSSYVLPEYVTPEQWGEKFEALGVPCASIAETA